MADFADIASDQQAALNDDALNQHRARTASQQGAISLEFCAECGEEIPAARRAYIKGCTLCVACQAENERHKGGS